MQSHGSDSLFWVYFSTSAIGARTTPALDNVPTGVNISFAYIANTVPLLCIMRIRFLRRNTFGFHIKGCCLRVYIVASAILAASIPLSNI
jgi:hypothetical protein